MSKLKTLLKRFVGWKHGWLAVLLIASMILHLGLLWHPKDLVLDEAYYIERGSRIYLVQGDLQQPEHPPLSKFFITAGMQIFGDNPFGWRIMSGVFGVGAIFFFYLILRQLKLSNAATNIATTLFAFENSTFLMASVGMLDIFNVTFMLAGFWAYLARRYPAAVAFLLLATLCKLTGLFGIIAIGLHWLVFRRDQAIKLAVYALIAYVAAILLVPGIEYILTGEWGNPLTRAAHLISVPGTITFANSTHPSALHPWQWVLGYHIMPFFWSPQYLAAVTPTVWALTLPVFVWTSWISRHNVLAVFKRGKLAADPGQEDETRRRQNETAFFAAAWIFATLIVWIIVGFITDRITYIFYFVPIVGGVILGIALFMDKAMAWARIGQPRPVTGVEVASVGLAETTAPVSIEGALPSPESAPTYTPVAEVPALPEVVPAEVQPAPEDILVGAPPVSPSRPTRRARLNAWFHQRNRDKKLVYIGIGVFVILHLVFFLSLSPFTNWWPITPS